MKALTLHQPWASAIALGLKSIETRGWATAYRGPIAIHAGKLGGMSYAWERLFGDLPEFRAAFQAAYPRGWFSLPESRIVAVADLVDLSRQPIDPANQLEYRLGDFSPGRWFWKLVNIRRVEGSPVAIGKQGLWQIPDDQVLPFIVQNAPVSREASDRRSEAP